MNVHIFLQEHHVPFETMPHRTSYSAGVMADALRMPGDQVAKTVLLRMNEADYVVAVLPATHLVDMDRLEQEMGGSHIELASEDELMHMFPDCEFGVVPAFGSQYGLTTIVDASLASNGDIIFEADSHDESISMRFNDFAEIEHPQIAEFTHHL